MSLKKAPNHRTHAKRLRVMGLAALALSTAAASQAQEAASGKSSDLTYLLGVKVWSHSWTTWGYATDNSNSTQAITQEPARGTNTAVIPQLSVRYQDFLFSVSGMLKHDYTMNASFGSYDQSRDEQDANLAYYVLPGLAFSVGYKKSTQSIPVNSQSWAGPTLGINAAASISEGLSMYGVLGIGRLKTDSKTGSGSTTVNDNTDYLLTEVGLAYTIVPSAFLKAATITFGYRSQLVTTKGIERRSFATPAAPSTYQDGRDWTQGLTVGLVTAF